MGIFVVFTVTVIALLWHHKSKGYFEIIEETGCHNIEFRLTCESLTQRIAIFEATFVQNDSLLEFFNCSCGDNNQTILDKSQESYDLTELKRKVNLNKFLEVNLRHIVNKRCSGISFCRFVISEDFEEASKLGPGVIFLRYVCVNESKINRGCNSNIYITEEGFVRTPGYPAYYVGSSSCSWTLKTLPFQRVKVTFLDVSLRGLAPHEEECLDRLTASENGLNLLSTCGDLLEDIKIISHGSSLNISFQTSSKMLFPKRGFLLHYKAVGCPTLRKPEDGYLINRNETFAHYRCCVGFVFPDTMSRDKILQCYNENTWDTDILDCISVKEIPKEKNSNVSTTNLTAEASAVMEVTDSYKDIVVPTIIICILFIGNGLILYFIYRHRKKLAKENKIELKELRNRERDTTKS